MLTALVLTDAELGRCLSSYWGLAGLRLTALRGGMSSATWLVEAAAGRWVAKAVPPDLGRPLAGGMAVARLLEQAGVPAGPAVPSTDGALVVTVRGHGLALLTWVPGHALTGQGTAQQQLIGATLAGVHRALAGKVVEPTQRFHWVDPDADHLRLRPWLRPAIAVAVEALDAVRPATMSWGLLHCDPAPDAFRLNPATGRCGVIDWSGAIYGPLLYDLASAVMYVGGPEQARPLTEAYLASGMLAREEVSRGLAAMLRFRWAVQADYFARRIVTHDLTGIAGPQDNEAGLADAARFLTGSTQRS